MKSNLGFSLVELLVTVAVSGILSAITIANYNQYKEKANDTVAIHFTKNVMTSLYASASEGKKYNFSGSVDLYWGCWGATQGIQGTGILPVRDQLIPGISYSHFDPIQFYTSVLFDSAGLITMQFKAAASHCQGSMSEGRTSVFLIDNTTNVIQKVTLGDTNGEELIGAIGSPPGGKCKSDFGRCR